MFLRQNILRIETNNLTNFFVNPIYCISFLSYFSLFVFSLSIYMQFFSTSLLPPFYLVVAFFFIFFSFGSFLEPSRVRISARRASAQCGLKGGRSHCNTVLDLSLGKLELTHPWVMRDEAYLWLFIRDPLTAFADRLDRQEIN